MSIRIISFGYRPLQNSKSNEQSAWVPTTTKLDPMPLLRLTRRMSAAVPLPRARPMIPAVTALPFACVPHRVTLAVSARPRSKPPAADFHSSSRSRLTHLTAAADTPALSPDASLPTSFASSSAAEAVDISLGPTPIPPRPPLLPPRPLRSLAWAHDRVGYCATKTNSG